ncbi:hypothetical protein EVAR_42659_1 [Eumeta japonica]|uniref:Uncharacterized protein n=1 Tax=Eumeta variegata TaxID=151549 RepID=A0A4C1YL05_EUMVA|nr:hypothetical protein EVAR_42659_1 [Eumeta japonica]
MRPHAPTSHRQRHRAVFAEGVKEPLEASSRAVFPSLNSDRFGTFTVFVKILCEFRLLTLPLQRVLLL